MGLSKPNVYEQLREGFRMKLYWIIFILISSLIARNIEILPSHSENPIGVKQTKKTILKETKDKLKELKKEIAQKKIDKEKFKVKGKTESILSLHKKQRKVKKEQHKQLDELKRKSIHQKRIKKLHQR